MCAVVCNERAVLQGKCQSRTFGEPHCVGELAARELGRARVTGRAQRTQAQAILAGGMLALESMLGMVLIHHPVPLSQT